MNGVEHNLKRLSLRSPFNNPNASKKPRHVSEYSIELDDPYKKFAPGDRIIGQVLLKVERPVRITHLTICLHGVVKVLKNGRIPAESTSRWRSYLATGQGKCGVAYFGNGLAALFKDEVILAGDGCLAMGLYQFNFDLNLPENDLPSSIDFQHGSISYMLSSTLTRPTTLSPTSKCERTITVKETIDVARLPQQSSQIIPLEYVQRKSRRAKTPIVNQNSGFSALVRAQQTQASLTLSSALSEASDERPHSPSASDVSTASSGKIDAERGSTPLNRRISLNGDGHSMTSSDEFILNPTITVKMLQSGCLPGDVISVKVSINQGQHFRNPRGIILTLYRECHIDLHPAIPLGSRQDGKKQRYEDYYPRSRTGLGGLSLSSAGSSRVFRQDINQKTTALYVDTQTLAADVKASLPVPEGVFPTISSVPGAMIDFKYYLETIIDLRGKSAIQERILPRLSMVNPVTSFGPVESRFGPEEGYNTQPQLNPGLSFFETSQIRRDKGVVTHVSEIVVGTMDSHRSRLKVNRPETHVRPSRRLCRGRSSVTVSDAHDGWYESGRVHPYAEHTDQSFDGYPENSHTIDFAPAHDISPPEVEDQMDEKTRLRRAEELLLPSSPLQESGGESSWREHGARQPTAPVPFDEDELPEFDPPGPSAPAYDRRVMTFAQDAGASTSQSSDGVGEQDDGSHEPMEDKQELERRRLQAQTSSPDGARMTNEVVDAADMDATAPVLDEDPAGAHQRQQHGDEHLPRYQA
ncbi:MAG: hypothetical protein LQ339_003640 [Xanthoria mediterranea]|nr:MAG: hypothetical protein LQ339_003640 [Xanthoria mediterranea]